MLGCAGTRCYYPAIALSLARIISGEWQHAQASIAYRITLQR